MSQVRLQPRLVRVLVIVLYPVLYLRFSGWLFNCSPAGLTSIVFGLGNQPRITRHPFAAFNGIGAQGWGMYRCRRSAYIKSIPSIRVLTTLVFIMSRYDPTRTESLAVPFICRWLLPAHSTLSGCGRGSICFGSTTVVTTNVAEAPESIRASAGLSLIVQAKTISWCAPECTAYMKLVWFPMV